MTTEDAVAKASPGIEFKEAPEGYVKVHANHHLWSKTRIGMGAPTKAGKSSAYGSALGATEIEGELAELVSGHVSLSCVVGSLGVFIGVW